MKIVYIMPELVSSGGADRVITEKANYFADYFNYDIYIITTYQKNRPFFYPLSSKVIHIDLNIDFPSQYKYRFIIRTLVYIKLCSIYKYKLRDLLQQIKPDYTITTINRDIDILHKINDGSIKVAEAHVAKEFSRNLHQLEAKGKFYKTIAYFLKRRVWLSIKKYDKLVVLTNEDAKKWERIKTAIVIPNALPFYPDKTSNCSEKKIISVGRIAEQKGYDLLVRCWKIVIQKHPDWEINVFGEGELKDSLEYEINLLRINESFHLLPPTSEIVNKYINSSFYVMSSRFEGFGMVLIEAMACGIPCISFDCPSGPSEIITNNKDGILVENGNIEHLANAICFLIENEDIRKKMGVQARKNVLRYKKENIMTQWKLFFELNK